MPRTPRKSPKPAQADDGSRAAPDAAAEARLDEALAETFPASDPVPINPSAD